MPGLFDTQGPKDPFKMSGGGSGPFNPSPSPQMPRMPFQNPMDFNQRRANAMALYGPKSQASAQPAGPGELGPPQPTDPPQFQPPPVFQAPATRPLEPGVGGGMMGKRMAPGPRKPMSRAGGFGPPPLPAQMPQAQQMGPDVMMKIQQLFRSNPQLFMQLLGPHLG